MASLSLRGIDSIVCGVCLYSICRMKPMGDRYVWTSDRRLPTPSVWCWSHSGDLTDSAKCALVWIASPGALLIMSARSTRPRACAETSASQSDGIKANFNTNTLVLTTVQRLSNTQKLTSLRLSIGLEPVFELNSYH